MSAAIYFEARRATPLSPEEEGAIRAIESRYSVATRIQEYVTTGRGLNWEGFARLPSVEEGQLFWGAVNLPNNTDDAISTGVQHWAAALAEIRRSLAGATWRVHVEDHELQWDDRKQAYDLSR